MSRRAAIPSAGALKEVPLGCMLKYVEGFKRGTNAMTGPKNNG